MKDIDTAKLRKIVENYKFNSKPSNGNSSEPCTINDLNRVIRNTANLFTQFIEELEN